jgi:methylmalonyl-CoA decarboxylase subunit alpha
MRDAGAAPAPPTADGPPEAAALAAPMPAADDLRQRAEWLSGRRRLAATGDELATRKRHDRGRLTARERVHALLDPGTFVETGLFARHRATGFGLEERRPETDGVITGWGEVHGRRVAVAAHDARIFGGSLGETFAGKVHALQDLAESARIPIVTINDGGGARIQEGVAALAGFGGIFRRNVRASGVIPQISVVAGACAGGAAYSPALTDVVVMVREASTMFVTGPDVVASVTGEKVCAAELGGADLHGTATGVAALVADDEEQSLEEVRYLLSFLPSSCSEPPPVYETTDSADRRCPELLSTVPADPQQSYDVRRVIAGIVDDGDYLELHEGWARNVVCALARLGGRSVGVVANQPAWLAGALDIDAAEKAARFVQFCDAFNIPLVTLVDVPGFLPGRDQESGGIVRRGAKLVHAYCAATVPRVTLVLRKAYGGAYIAMDSKAIGADLVFAWPSNEIAVMGPGAAAEIVFRRRIAAAADPQETRRQLVEEYSSRLVHPMAAAELGLVDDVIDPADSRRVLVQALALLAGKAPVPGPRKHANGPL